MMDEQRKGKIAILLLKLRFREHGIRLSGNTRRELGNTAKEPSIQGAGISMEELTEFMRTMVQELVDESFPVEGSGF